MLFAYCRYYPARGRTCPTRLKKDKLPEDAFYHLYEMNLDGSGVRQLTHGRYDDFDARYLPDGEIVFLSTRKGQFLQCDKASTAATDATADLPDSYVRCGGDNYRPVPVFTLHAMDADGGEPAADLGVRELRVDAGGGQRRADPLRPLGLHRPLQRPLLQPVVDQPRRHQRRSWSTATTRSQPQCVFEARPIPNSQKLIFTAAAHHSITGGSLVLLDRTQGTESERPLTRLTPEVRFPETEGWRRRRTTPTPSRCPRSTTWWPGATASCRRTAACRRRRPSNPVNATGHLPVRRLRQPEPALPRPGDLQQRPDPGPAAAAAAGLCPTRSPGTARRRARSCCRTCTRA